MVVASVEIQRYLVYILVLLVEQMNTYLGSVQMQPLADHGPNNNILYSHGPQLLVYRDSHEQNVQALALSHHVDKGTNPILNHLPNLIELEIGSKPTQR